MKMIKYMIMLSSIIMLISTTAVAQVEIENLYDRYWQINEEQVIKQNGTSIDIYFRYEDRGIDDLGRITKKFYRDGTSKGINISGYPISSTWKLLPENRISSGSDANAAYIVKLTKDEFIVEVRQLYTSSYSGKPYNIVRRTKYGSFDPCIVFESLRSGDWNDPTLWTCQKVPTVADAVLINKDHTVTIPVGFIASAKTIETKGTLDLKNGAKLSRAK